MAPTSTTGADAGGDFTPVPLAIGTLLPQTGALSPIHDSLAGGVLMAVEEINAVYPDLVTVEQADGATDPAIASENVDQFLTGDHAAIMGAADSGSVHRHRGQGADRRGGHVLRVQHRGLAERLRPATTSAPPRPTSCRRPRWVT